MQAATPLQRPVHPRDRLAQAPRSMVMVPIHYTAWIRGDMGAAIIRQFEGLLAGVPAASVSPVVRGLLVEADEDPGPLVEAVLRAVRGLEASIRERYPVFFHELGPFWTGTLQCVFAVDGRPPPAVRPVTGT